MGLGCLALAMGAGTLVNSGAASAAEAENPGARIIYRCSQDTKKVWVEDDDHPKGGYYDSVVDKDAPIKGTGEYFSVIASSGSVVTYKEGKTTVSAEPDYTNDDYYYEGYDRNDYYYENVDEYIFKLPKKGERVINVSYNGKETATLKISADSPKKNPAVKTEITCKKAKYVPNAEGYAYGNITADTEGTTSGAIHAYVLDVEGDKDYYMNSFCRGDASDIGKEDDKSEMNDFIQPLLREGATVVVAPYSYDYDSDYSRNSTNKDVYYTVSTYTATELKVAKTTDTYKFKCKVAKVKIPKLKNPPKVKVDAVKGTIKLTAKMEYRFKRYEEDGTLGSFSEWADGKAKMSINDVSTASITCGGIIEVRTKATSKALYSKTASITLPSQQAIDVSKIAGDGVITGGSINASGYEYTTSDPKSGGAKWTAIKDAGIKFTAKKPAASGNKYYIREKGVNEKGDTKLKMPSEIAVFTVSGSSLKVTTDGTGSYITTMSALY